jgi:hypothetical protein
VDNRVYVIGHDNTLMRQLTQMGVHMFGAIESIKSARIKPAISFDSSLAPLILKHRISVGLKYANITVRASEQTWKGGAACSTSSLLARRPRQASAGIGPYVLPRSDGHAVSQAR